MRERYLILDFDGVLNDSLSFFVADSQDIIDLGKVELLKRLVQLTNCQIVFNTKRREAFEPNKAIASLKNQLGWQDIPVSGITPLSNSGFRGIEVAKYCWQHDVHDYIILDDSSNYFIGQKFSDEQLDAFKKDLSEKELNALLETSQPLIQTSELYGFRLEEFMAILRYWEPGSILHKVYKDVRPINGYDFTKEQK
jgi:DNA-binding LytR/AlgR family response regulator